MLMGEYAVLHGEPCIVTAVSARMRVTVRRTETDDLVLHAEDVGLMNFCKPIQQLGVGNISKATVFVETSLRNFREAYPFDGGLIVETSSEFPATLGFGSSSAITVAIIAALSSLLKVCLTDRQIFDLSYKTVLDVQKKGSGFDVAAAVYGGTLLFTSGGTVIEPIDVSPFPLIVGYTAIKADTVTLIDAVGKSEDENPSEVHSIFEKIGALVLRGRSAMEDADWRTLGTLFNHNQMLLTALGVSHPKLDTMMLAACDAGALGAKLSGAGGGDCMIAVAEANSMEIVKKAIASAGGQIIPVTFSALGVTLH